MRAWIWWAALGATGCGGDPFVLAEDPPPDVGASYAIEAAAPAAESGRAASEPPEASVSVDAQRCVTDCAILGCGLHSGCGGPTINCGPCDNADARPTADTGAVTDVARIPEAATPDAIPVVDEAGDADAGLSPDDAAEDMAAPMDAGSVVCLPGVGCCGPSGVFGCYSPPNTANRIVACCAGLGTQSTGGYCSPLLDSGSCSP